MPARRATHDDGGAHRGPSTPLPRQLTSVSADKDGIISKLTDDLTKCFAELDRVQKQLHRAQDAAARLEPAAAPVLELRARQREHDAAVEAASHLNPLARLSALQRLGKRPTLTL